MTERGQFTYEEIYSQPDLWRTALDIFETESPELAALWESEDFERVILTGCGSTYYLAQIGAWLIQQQTGVPAVGMTASELMLFPEMTLRSPLKTLFITVSRSGTTRETVEAARHFREFGVGQTLAITCHGESVLARESDHVLAVDDAREMSRAQTRSFSSMAVLLQALAGRFGGNPQAAAAMKSLPDTLRNVITNYGDLTRELGQRQAFSQFIFLGSGVLYGVACEAMLKMAEMSLVPSTAFHTLEFLHGPKYTVNSETLVLVLLSESILDEEIAALEDAHNRGATILMITEADIEPSLSRFGQMICLDSALPMSQRAILYLPPLQLAAYHQSMTRGKNPDLPGQ